MEISILTIGGIFLVSGALYLLVGNVFLSVLNYLLADICWIINAFQNNDYFGSISISIGIIVGLIVAWKMQVGIFRKNLKIEKD